MLLATLCSFWISIHASEKEATGRSLWCYLWGNISIHASEKEATRIVLHFLSSHKNFNPRLREGGDDKLNLGTLGTLISIHASEKEATWISQYTVSKYMISIHASEKEATLFFYAGRRERVFQSTPPRRRRLQHIVIPQLSCTYLVSTTFLSAIFSFISQYIVLFFLF